jgi:hypothetical protein
VGRREQTDLAVFHGDEVLSVLAEGRGLRGDECLSVPQPDHLRAGRGVRRAGKGKRRDHR